MSKKDIASLFQSAEKSLEQQPSAKAWERLESRLDEEQAAQRFSIRRWLTVAASVAVLLVAGGYFYNSLADGSNTRESTVAKVNQDFSVELVSENGSTSENEKGFYRVVEFQRKYQDRLSNPSFQEGARKRLAVSASYRNVPTQKSIGQFQWLIGQWKGTGEKIVLDEWQQSSSDILEGRGFGLVDGEVIFLEQMKLQQIGQHLYFMVDLFGAEDLLKYKLISFDGRQATFENPKAPFPNQVVLKRTAMNSFELIMQHSSSQPPSKAQVERLKVRNDLQNEHQIYRKMRKLN
jgi:hypothetical protein